MEKNKKILKIKKCINECENRAMNFIFGSYEFKYDSGASEKHFIFLKKIVNLFEFLTGS